MDENHSWRLPFEINATHLNRIWNAVNGFYRRYGSGLFISSNPSSAIRHRIQFPIVPASIVGGEHMETTTCIRHMAFLAIITLIAATAPRVSGAAHTWIGGAANNNWSTAANWLNNSAPATNEAAPLVL